MFIPIFGNIYESEVIRMKKNYVDMGLRIKSRRKEMNLTQNELAEMIGVSNNHLSSIENGKETPSLDTLLNICTSLKTKPDYLLLGSLHSNNIPQNIIDTLQLCSEHDVKLALRMVRFMAEMNSDKWKLEE